MRRFFRGHLPPDDPRVFQGAAVPRRGQRDPRAFGRAGPAPHGRPAQQDPLDLLDHDGRGLAISGIPPFSGFFSKDAILLAAYHHAPWMYWLGVFTAGMTAFYVFRAMFLAFFGEYRGDRHPHESPPAMLIPLVVLALLSVAGGFLFKIPEFLGTFSHARNHRGYRLDGHFGGGRFRRDSGGLVDVRGASRNGRQPGWRPERASTR